MKKSKPTIDVDIEVPESVIKAYGKKRLARNAYEAGELTTEVRCISPQISRKLTRIFNNRCGLLFVHTHDASGPATATARVKETTTVPCLMSV